MPYFTESKLTDALLFDIVVTLIEQNKNSLRVANEISGGKTSVNSSPLSPTRALTNHEYSVEPT